MIQGKKILALIPARGGSKGLPGKNIRKIGGKPLIAWSIEAAKNSKYVDRVVLSSEDEEIISIAREWDCDVPFVRPAELAQDDSPSMEVVLHAILILKEYEYIVLLQPTSPLRTATDIDGCIDLCIEQSAKAVVSVTEPDKSPYWMFDVDESTKRLEPLIRHSKKSRRQDLPKVYALNGALYLAQREWLLENQSFIGAETVAYVMPKASSFDIDTELDFIICECMLNHALD